MEKYKIMIAVIDGQGGGIGKSIVEKLKEVLPDIPVRAVGTNSVATSCMLRAGADDGATGENAIICNAKNADIIIGVMGILKPNGLLGELTPKMVNAIGTSSAVKILIPMNQCGIKIACEAVPLNRHIEMAVQMAKTEIDEKLKNE